MIFNYIRRYGNDSFAEVKPNAIDLLIFSEMSNFNYDHDYVGEPIAQAIQSAVLPTITDPEGRTIVALDNKEDLELAKMVKLAKRYRNVTFRDFREHHVDHEQQFGALAVVCENVLCVAFRATDLTVTGWQESLELSMDKPTGSQTDAAAFLERNYASWDGPMVICGHSKGGNLAEYACRELVENHPEAADRILCICSFDGPGLAPHYRNTMAYARIAPLIHTFIPKSSIVGNIHDHPRAGLVYVDSYKPFVQQHYVYNWKTSGTQLIHARQTWIGKVTSRMLNWLISITDDAAKNRIFQTLFAPYRVLRKPLL